MAQNLEVLREKLKAVPRIQLSVPYDFSNIDIESIGKKSSSQFITNIARAISDEYFKNDPFKKFVDENELKGKDSFYRAVYDWIEANEDKITNTELLSKLRNTGPLVKQIISETFKDIKRIESQKKQESKKPVEKQPLNAKELESFGISGLIDSDINEESVRDAIRFYKSNTTDSLDEQNSKIDRFKITVSLSKKDRQPKPVQNILTDAEAEKYFSNDKSFGINKVSDIKADISELELDSLVKNLVKSRKESRIDLDSVSKKELLHKLFNTVLSIKEDAYINPDKYPNISESIKQDIATREKGNKKSVLFIDKLRNKKYVDDLIEHIVSPRSRVEVIKKDTGELQKLSEQERAEFNKLDKFKQRLKVDDPARVMSIAYQLLIMIRNFQNKLKSFDYSKILDRSLGRVLDSMPGAGEIEEYLDLIDNQLTALSGLSNADIPYLISTQDGELNKKNLNDKIIYLQKNLRDSIKRLEDEDSMDKKKEIADEIKKKRQDANRLVRLSKVPKKALYDSVDRYLSFLKDKKDSIIDLKKDISKDVSNLTAILEGALDIYNFFRDLSRQKDYRNRWSIPGTISEEETDKAKEVDFNKDLSNKNAASDIKKYQTTYGKIRDGLSDAEKALSEIQNIIKAITYKTLSIVEASPDRSNVYSSLLQKAKEIEDPKEKQEILRLAEKSKKFVSGFDFPHSLANNPYGGKGPKIEEAVEELRRTVSDLNKVDIRRRLDQAISSIEELQNVNKWLKIKKEKEALDGFRMAATIRKLANHLEAAEARRKAPSNIPQGTDVTFFRTRGSKRIPNFLIQDSTGLVKKLIEYLEKNWENYTSGDEVKAEKAIDDAIQKVLKTKGSLSDWLDNRVQQIATKKSDVSKAHKEIKRITEDQINSSKELETLNSKYIPAIERLISFVNDPLGHINKAIKGDSTGKLKADNKQFALDRYKEKLTELISRASAISDISGLTLLEKIRGKEGLRLKGDQEILNIGLPRPTFLMLERIKKAGDSLVKPITRQEAESVFISKFNDAFKGYFQKPLNSLPTDSDIAMVARAFGDNSNSKESYESFRKKCLIGLGLKTAESEEDLKSPGFSKEWLETLEKMPRDPLELEKERSENLKKFTTLFNKTYGTKFSIKNLPTQKDIENLIENWVKSEQEYLEGYNKIYSRTEDTLPSLNDINHLSKIRNSQELRSPTNDSEKKWLKDFSTFVGTDFSKIPTYDELKNFALSKLKKPQEEVKDKKREEALDVLENIPKNMEEAIKRIPASVVDKKWFKEIRNDKSSHKTRWIERIFNRMDKPPEGVEDFSRHLKALSNDVSILVQEAKKAEDLASMSNTVRVNLNRLFNSIIEASSKKVPVEDIVDVNSFKQKIYFPVKELLRKIEDYKRLLSSAIPLIHNYREINSYYEAYKGKISESELEGLEGEERETKRKELLKKYEDIRKAQRVNLDKIEAMLSGLNGSLNDVTDNLKLVKKEIIPLFEQAIANFEKPSFKEFVSNLEDSKFIKDIEKTLKDIFQSYKKALVSGGKVTSKEVSAAKDSDKTPYDIALDTKGGKEDLGPIKNRADAYNKIEKTIQYFKKISDQLEDLKVGEPLEDVKDVKNNIDFFKSLGSDAGNLVESLKNQIIPGLDKLLKTDVELSKEQGIVANLDNAVQKLDDLMQEYTSKRTQLLNRLDFLAKDRQKQMDIIRDFEGYFDPETGEYKGISEKEKKIMTRFFLRILYKHLDELWSQIPGKAYLVTGERHEPNYLRVWKRFQNIAGPSSNRQLMSLLSAIKADIRPDEKDFSKRIKFKGDELKVKYDRLAKRYEEMGRNPEGSEELKDLLKMINWLKEKEKSVDKVFAFMRKTSDLDYLSNIREALREKSKEVGTIENESDYIAIPENKDVKEEVLKDLKAFDEVVERAKKVVDKKDDLKLESKIVETPSIEKVQSMAEDMISQLDEALKGLGLNVESSEDYRNDKNFDLKILYSPIIQKTIRDLICDRIFQ